MIYEKKLKIRLCFAVCCAAAGILLVALCCLGMIKAEVVIIFGATLSLIGIYRIINYLIIIKNKEAVKRQKIAENDERTVSIMYKARSAAFIIYIVTAAVGVIFFQVAGKSDLASLLGFSVAFLVFVYSIFYFIFNKKY